MLSQKIARNDVRNETVTQEEIDMIWRMAKAYCRRVKRPYLVDEFFSEGLVAAAEACLPENRKRYPNASLGAIINGFVKFHMKRYNERLKTKKRGSSTDICEYDDKYMMPTPANEIRDIFALKHVKHLLRTLPRKQAFIVREWSSRDVHLKELSREMGRSETCAVKLLTKAVNRFREKVR